MIKVNTLTTNVYRLIVEELQLRKYYVMALVRGMFTNLDDCESFFEGDEWYFKGADQEGKKVVPIFPHLRKVEVLQHQYFGSILSEDAEPDSEKFWMSQILLEVVGNSEPDVTEEIMEGGWIRPQSGLTVYPPLVSIKGFQDQSLANIEWELKSGA